jgi:thioredoxin 1
MFRMKFLSAAILAVLACPLALADDPPSPAPAKKEQPVKPVEVTTKTWNQEVLQSKLPVLVDFYAPWCGPCKTTAPHVDKAAETYKGKLKVTKVNTDNEPGLAARYGVSGIPTLIIIAKGQVVTIEVGGKTEAQLKKMIEDTLKALEPKKP